MVSGLLFILPSYWVIIFSWKLVFLKNRGSPHGFAYFLAVSMGFVKLFVTMDRP